MRNVALALLAGLVVGGAGAWTLARERAQPADAPPAAEVEVARETARVQLDPAARELAGIEVAPVTARELAAERRAYGRVLDPTPLAGQVYELAAATPAYTAAAREETRVRALFRGQENASQRELEAAQVALGRAKLGIDTARARLVTAWGAELAGRDDLDALVRDLVAGRRALVRIDVPPGPPRVEPSGLARLESLDADAPLAATFLGPAPQTDPLLQGSGLLFLVERDPPGPGTAVTAWLPERSGKVRGVDVPREALLRHQGGVFVYVQHDARTFERRGVELLLPTEAGWLATGALTPGEQVVVSGAALLLSSELQPQLEED